MAALRELTGESYFISTGRNLVCVEGETGIQRSKASDRSLIEILNVRSSRYTFLPMGGKSQVVSSVTRLRESLPVDVYGVTVVGLVDADQADAPPAGCVAWPFCEIENALLLPAAMAEAANELGAATAITEPEVALKLQAAATALRDDEIRMRAAGRIGRRTFIPSGTGPDELRASIDAFVAGLAQLHGSSDIEDVFAEVTAAVDGQLGDGSYVKKFRGKRLLRAVFNELGLVNVSYSTFCYLLAQKVREDATAAAELDAVFTRLDAVVDAQLATVLVPLEVVETVPDGDSVA